MAHQKQAPGAVRDAIIHAFQAKKTVLTVTEVREAVCAALGDDVPASSVRSYLGNNTPGRFERVGPGKYRFIR